MRPDKIKNIIKNKTLQPMFEIRKHNKASLRSSEKRKTRGKHRIIARGTETLKTDKLFPPIESLWFPAQ